MDVASSAATAGESSGLREIELSVQGMTCAACAARVEKKVDAIDNVAAMVVFAKEKASITEQVTSCPG